MQSLPNQVPPTLRCHEEILRAFPRAQNEPTKTLLRTDFPPRLPTQPAQNKGSEDSMGPFLRITLFADDYESPGSGRNHPKGKLCSVAPWLVYYP